MLLFSFHQVFSYILMMSLSVMTVFAKTWLDLWLLMELLNMMFVPMMGNPVKSNSSVNMFKMYSLLAILSYLMLVTLMWNNVLFLNSLLPVLFVIKLNASPFYMLFLSMIPQMGFQSLFFFFTFNKLPGFIGLTSLLDKENPLILALIMLTLVMPTTQVMNETYINSVLFLSSVYHTAWMLVAMTNGMMKEWLVYFIFYSCLITVVLMLTETIGLVTVVDLHKGDKTWGEVGALVTFMTLMGTPPSCGFFLKMIIISSINVSGLSDTLVVLSGLLVGTSSIWTYFYFSLCVKLWVNTESSLIKKVKKTFLFMFLNTLVSLWVLMVL